MSSRANFAWKKAGPSSIVRIVAMEAVVKKMMMVILIFMIIIPVTVLMAMDSNAQVNVVLAGIIMLLLALLLFTYHDLRKQYPRQNKSL